jgi:hypothetical protein
MAYYDATKSVLTALEANPTALPAGSPLAKPVSAFVATAKSVRVPARCARQRTRARAQAGGAGVAAVL